MSDFKYKRVLLKLSGEALMGSQSFGIDPAVPLRLAEEIRPVYEAGVEVAVVVGGGNIYRGVQGAANGMDRAQGDNMGMLATVINALALQDTFEKAGMDCRVMSAIEMRQIAEPYIRRRAIRHLEKGRITIFAAGTGNPYFTTDTGAALRACEINAEILMKATNVDGVYAPIRARTRTPRSSTPSRTATCSTVISRSWTPPPRPSVVTTRCPLWSSTSTSLAASSAQSAARTSERPSSRRRTKHEPAH